MPTKKNREETSDTYGNGKAYGGPAKDIEKNAASTGKRRTRDKMPSIPGPDMPWIGGDAAQRQARKPKTKV